MRQPCLTFVIPTYEPHFGFVSKLVGSIARFASDPEQLAIRIVVEEQNRHFVESLAMEWPALGISCTTTETILDDFGIGVSAGAFLAEAGKFTFQSIKKIGGILASGTDWVLVMDSESLFTKPFSIRVLLEDYASRKYVFFSQAADRHPHWCNSLAETVTQNASLLLGGQPDKWLMEYYHWFYETAVWRDLVQTLKRSGALRTWLHGDLKEGVFENILYYQFVSINPQYGYRLIDVSAELKRYLPERMAGRLDSAPKGRLGIVGLLEYIASLISVDEFHDLARFFDAYRLPFLRLEPSAFDARILTAIDDLPSVCAITSSHRIQVIEKRVAVCIAGEFRSVFSNIRAIQSFLSGVACDVFVHSWSHDSVPVVMDVLRPDRLVEEAPVDFSQVASTIGNPEPDLKPDRDKGALSMLYGISASIAMLGDAIDRYAYVVRLRPDCVFQESLRDLLFNITDDDEHDGSTIYVPDGFHSQGINDQFAIGSASAMARYAKVFDYAEQVAGHEYFNPEHLVASCLLDEGITIKTLPMIYILLRKEPNNLDWVGRVQHLQNTTWWSAPLPGPRKIRKANALFRHKREAMRFMRAEDCFGDWTLVVDASAIAGELRPLMRSERVEVRVRRDHKNPDVFLTTDVRDGTRVDEMFVEVRDDGLHLRYNKPPGILFVHAADVDGHVQLTRFEDDLDRPSAVLRFAIGAQSHATAGRPETAPPPRLELHIAKADSDDGDHALLQTLGPRNRRGALDPVRKLWARRLLHRGRALRRRDQPDEAKRLYARLLRLDPAQPREWVQYGHLAKDSGDREAALGAYRMALLLAPGDADAARHYRAVAGDRN